MHVYPTSLDRQAGRFREAFESDSTFELLHFLPLYFGPVQPTTMLEVLSEIAGGRSARLADQDAAFASSVLAAVLRTRDQKRVLGEFADALKEEWNVFLRESSNGTSGRQAAELAAASRRWREEVAPAVSGFLNARHTTSGTVIVSAALGPEGRVLTGSSENTSDNLFAVSSANNLPGLGIAAFLLKELCYPLASGVVSALGFSRDRVNAERMSGRLAVRCGAELLEASSRALAGDYRATFLAAAAASGIAAPTFEAAYAVDAGVLERLRRSLRETAP
jgi:hypothetical protein